MAATKKATANKSTTKKSTTARKPTAKKTATKRPTNAKSAATPLLEREPQVLVQDVSYAFAGFGVEAVALAKAAVTKIDELRSEVSKAAQDPKATVSSAPAHVEKTVESVRAKLIAELESAIKTFETTFDTRATEGRKLIGDLKKDKRVSRFLDQTSSTRSQLKSAFTSITKTGQVAVEAGVKQAETASSQVKGAVTSVTKTGQVAVEAGVKQADVASSQVKGAVTSVTKTVDAAPDAFEASVDKVDEVS